MPEESHIFRKIALERLSSPEQLDHLMQVTLPRGWLALFAAATVILAALVWGIFGTIPTSINGSGILIRGGSVYDVVSSGAGVVTQVCVRANDVIAEQDVVARLSQPELDLRIRHTELERQDLLDQNEKLMRSETETLRIDSISMGLERTNLASSIRDYGEQLNALEKKLAKQQEALKAGLIVESALLTTQIDIFSAQQSRAQAGLKLNQIAALEVDRPMQLQQQQNARRQRIEDVTRTLILLRKQMELASIVRSPYAGRVLELTVDVGNLITTGGRILSLEKLDHELEAVVFVPAAEGKRIQKDMPVRLSPSTVKKEESGFILGTVNNVLPFPSTPEGMMRVLRNNELVRQWAAIGAPIEVHVSLQKDGRGYRWSSVKKSPPTINSGTLCTSAIIVESNSPISLVFPILKKPRVP
jgi:HlyD family secretion protein